MIAEAVLVDTSQAQAQLAQQQQQHQQQMQQQAQQQQAQQQTAMPMGGVQAESAMSTGPMSSGPMGQANGANGTTRKPRRAGSGDGCCDNAQERAKAAVAKVAPCACKFKLNITSLKKISRSSNSLDIYQENILAKVL